MKQKISLWQFVGFSLTSLLGTLLHFLYEWSGQNIFTALISGVNESTWEHMKLLYFPLFAFALAQSFFFKENPNFWCIKLRGIVLGLALIPMLFYTYNGVIGVSPDWINISIFFIAAAATFVYESRYLKRRDIQCREPWLAFLIICFIGVFFILFTFVTPRIGIFLDPITGSYGIE